MAELGCLEVMEVLGSNTGEDTDSEHASGCSQKLLEVQLKILD